MPRARAATSLELEEDESALRREWRFERIGWGAIAFVLVAGLAGLFGDGRLASASVSTVGGGAVVHYERIVRHGAPSEISLRLASAAGADTIAVVSLDEQYLSGVDVQQVRPAPLQVRAAAGQVEYHLLRLDPIQPMTIVLSVRGEAVGVHRAALTTSQGTLALRQLVLP